MSAVMTMKSKERMIPANIVGAGIIATTKATTPIQPNHFGSNPLLSAASPIAKTRVAIPACIGQKKASHIACMVFIASGDMFSA